MNACPSFDELSRAASEGRTPALEAHLAGCTACVRTVKMIDGLRLAARALPWAPPADDAASRMEARLLAQAEVVRPATARRWRVPAALAAAAAAVVLWFVLLPAALPAPPQRGTVTGAAGADYVLELRPSPVEGLPPAEVVRLAHGSIELQVDHLGEGERFLVATADAEVEVRGTQFRVEAAGGELVAVSVTSGKVEVRARGAAPVLLHPGERWDRPAAVVAAVAAEPAVPAAAPPVTAAAPREQRVAHVAAAPVHVPEASDDELEAPQPVPEGAEPAFAAAWSALRSGEPAAAAEGFARVPKLPGGDELAEDAAYWRIVALARAGAVSAAEDEMERFLHDNDAAARAGEVALMLGLRRLAAGDRDEASALLRRAAADPAPGIRAKAEEALRRL